MVNKKKIILAVGCSYTEPNFKSSMENLPPEKRGGWPMWPELFKNKLEKETGKSYELINLAMGGTGHDYMFDQLIKYIVKYKDQISIILWGGTQFHRRMDGVFGLSYNSMAYHFMKNLSRASSSIGEGWIHFCEYSLIASAMREFSTFGMKAIIDKNLSFIWLALNMCNNYNIKFLYYQLLSPWPDYKFTCASLEAWGQQSDKVSKQALDKVWQSNYMLDTDFAKDIIKNKKSFLGFQMFGETAWDRQSREEKEMLRIYPFFDKTNSSPGQFDMTKVDGHPNAAGQKDIANKVWKHYVRNLA